MNSYYSKDEGAITKSERGIGTESFGLVVGKD